MNGWINQHNKNGCPFCMFSSWSKPWKWFVLVRNKKKNQPISLNQEKSGNKLCFEVGHSCSEADLRWPWSNQGFSNCAQMNSCFHFLNESAATLPIRGSEVTLKRILSTTDISCCSANGNLMTFDPRNNGLLLHLQLVWDFESFQIPLLKNDNMLILMYHSRV